MSRPGRGPGQPFRVAVVGGGIAGLAAAHRLVEASGARGTPVDVTLFEAGDRLGGTIRTERVDDFLVEAGPDSFITEKPWALALAERIGLGPRLCRTDDRFRRTYVARAGRLHPLPEGFLLLAPVRLAPFLGSALFSWRGKARMGLDLVLPRRRSEEDESLGAFVRRRLGREALERVAEPLVAGIYTADAERLSLAATMPRFLALERRHRSLILGLRRSAGVREVTGASGARWSLFVTLAGGMGELVDALAARLPRETVRLGCRIVAATRVDGGWRLHAADGGTTAVAGVVLAGAAPAMAPIVRAADADLARLLAGVRYASSATVTLAYRRAAVRHALDGFGFVVPRGEGRALLACTFSSVKYPGRAPEGYALLRGFLGGAGRGAVLDRDDSDLVRLVEADLAALVGAARPPVLGRVARHRGAMPQYDVGHLDRVAALERRVGSLPGLALAGAAYRGVGIADCVRSGE
ncbi:MAG: protoporphyrinogen oxidase, partial [Candidatus Rokuibacteriota bacterium]